jgi:hypothetical protein
MTNYTLDNKDKSILKRYETHLIRANDGYVRGLYESDLNNLEPIYNKFGFYLENRHCSTCVLGMMQFLAERYFKRNKV